MYHVVLFVHLLGVAVLTAAIAVEVVTSRRIAMATEMASVRDALGAGKLVAALFPIATVLLIASGSTLVVMSGTDWRTGWLAASVVVVIVMTVAGEAVTGRKMRALAGLAFASQSREVTAEVDAARRDPALAVAGYLSSTEGVALLYLMSNKPGTSASVLIVVAAAGLSIVLGLHRARGTAAQHRVTAA